MTHQRKQDITAIHVDFQAIEKKLLALQMDLESEGDDDADETEQQELHFLGEAVEEALEAVEETATAINSVIARY